LNLSESAKEIVMNLTRHICRVAAFLVGLTVAVLAATPAFAMLEPDPGGYAAPTSVPAQIQYRTIVAGGMPGWQIALIAVGAALLAAVAAVLADRARAARRPAVPVAA
jgi:hypothetical protein